MNKKLIRLAEQDLHKIVKESVNRILNETLIDSKSANVLYECTHKINDQEPEDWYERNEHGDFDTY